MITSVMRELRRERRLWMDRRRVARKRLDLHGSADLASNELYNQAQGAIWALDAAIRRMGGV